MEATVPRATLGLAAALASFFLLYWSVFAGLLRDWEIDENYSHGFLIVPLALYLAYERRERLRSAVASPTALGLVLIVGSIGVLIAGTLGAELFLTRVSLVGVILGIVLYVYGPQHAQILAFPVAILLLMIPLPSIIFNQIAFPLQLVASRFGETTLHLARIPVLREGNIIFLANTTLEVAEACSGIRSLVSLLTLGIVLGYFTDSRMWVRVVIALSTVPVAIVANGMRVAGTGVAAYRFGAEAATGFLHTFSGWLVFGAAWVRWFVVQRRVVLIAPAAPRRGSRLALQP